MYSKDMKPKNAEDLAKLKESLTQDEFNLVKDLLSDQDSEWQKRLNSIPLFAPLLASFGLVSTFYGFEKILDKTILVQQPVLLLAVGIFALLLTGAFYRKL